MSPELLRCQSHLYVGAAIQAVIVAVALSWRAETISPLQQLVTAAIFLGLAFLLFPRSQNSD